MAEKKKELAVKEEEIKDLSIFAVEEGQEEHLSQDEMEMPFLKLAQDSTKQTKAAKAEYIKGLEPGMFFNTVTQDIYGSELKAQVQGYFHNYVIWKGPKGNGKYQGTMTTEEFRVFEKSEQLTRDGGDMVQTVNGESLRYTDTHSFIVTLPEHPGAGMLIYPLSSTGCKVARTWNSLHTNRRLPGGRPAKRYATLWDLKVSGFTSDQGFDYKQVSNIKAISWATAELNELGKSFEAFVKSIKDKGVKFEDDNSSSTEVPENSEF